MDEFPLRTIGRIAHIVIGHFESCNSIPANDFHFLLTYKKKEKKKKKKRFCFLLLTHFQSIKERKSTFNDDVCVDNQWGEERKPNTQSMSPIDGTPTTTRETTTTTNASIDLDKSNNHLPGF